MTNAERRMPYAEWPGSRVISAQKANTANAFSLPGLALSTANLYSAVQPGGSLFGLQESNPVRTDVAYGGNAGNDGRPNDPMVGQRIGGVNVFGGGLSLYTETASCWAASESAATRPVPITTSPGGPATRSISTTSLPVSVVIRRKDNIVYDITPPPGQMPGLSASGWGHPTCTAAATAIAAALPGPQ